MTYSTHKSTLRTSLTGLATALVMTFGATAAQAAPVTWLFGGLVSSVAPGSGGGFPPAPGSTVLSSLFSIGDPFTLSFSFDDATIGTQDTSITGPQPARTYADDTTNSISLSGETFTLTAPDISGNNQRRVFNSGSTEKVESDSDDDTSPSGNATSSVAGVDEIFLDWELDSSIGNVLPDVAPAAVVFPTTIDLADWAEKTFELFIRDADINASATIKGSFETFQVAGSGVPSPGALALIGFGLIGLSGLRRRMA